MRELCHATLAALTAHIELVAGPFLDFDVLSMDGRSTNGNSKRSVSIPFEFVVLCFHAHSVIIRRAPKAFRLDNYELHHFN
jgi:hypothetical protein